MINLEQLLETLSSGLLGQLLYPLYLVLVWLTAPYIALIP